MKKQSIAIIGVIALVLAVAVGYALFSETITVDGTATAKGSFDVEFTEVGDAESDGYTQTEGTELAVISTDKNTLTVTVDKLNYPGAYVEFPVTVTNVGTIPAVLKNIEQTGLDADSSPIKVTYSGTAATESEVAPNAEKTLNVRVEWLEGDNTTAENVEFDINLEYEQVRVTTQQ